MIDFINSHTDPISWFFLLACIGFGAGVVVGFVSRSFRFAYTYH